MEDRCSGTPVPSVILPVFVLVAWVVLAVMRESGQAEPSWIDRGASSGRSLVRDVGVTRRICLFEG